MKMTYQGAYFQVWCRQPCLAVRCCGAEPVCVVWVCELACQTGFGNRVMFRIVEELRHALPRVLGGLTVWEMWSYKVCDCVCGCAWYCIVTTILTVLLS